MINATIDKFGYPATLVREFDHWLVLLRAQQVTLGSLVIAAKSPATAYGELPASAFAQQAQVISATERALRAFTGFERINYLMLMMIDPHVHFHVIPRYSGGRRWKGLSFPDAGWPSLPDLKNAVTLDAAQIVSMNNDLSILF